MKIVENFIFFDERNVIEPENLSLKIFPHFTLKYREEKRYTFVNNINNWTFINADGEQGELEGFNIQKKKFIFFHTQYNIHKI